MVCPKVYRMTLDREYHIVELEYWPSAELLEWTIKTFGPQGSRWFTRPPRIYFQDPKDHLMFLLSIENYVSKY